MTLVAISCHDDQAEIVTDSLTCSGFGRTVGTITKLHTLPHLDVAVTTQGEYGFHMALMAELYTTATLSGFGDVVERVAERVGHYWEHRRSVLGDELMDSTVYVVGHDRAQGRYRAVSVPFADGFPVVNLDGFHLFPAPISTTASAPDDLQGWGDLVNHVYAERSLDVLDTGRKVLIGGRVLHTRMTPGVTIQGRIAEMPLDGPIFHQLMAGTNHPSSQLAPCGCQSGRLYADCCQRPHEPDPCDCGSGRTFGDCCVVRTDHLEPTTGCPCGRAATVANCCAPHLGQPTPPTGERIARNAACPCHSGRKHKHCCGALTAA